MQGKGLDLSIIISLKEIFDSIRRNMHLISVAKPLRLSIKQQLFQKLKRFACHQSNIINKKNNDFSSFDVRTGTMLRHQRFDATSYGTSS